MKIKKIDATTIKIDNKNITIEEKVLGTDYYIHSKDDEYFVSNYKNNGDALLVGGFHYGLIPEDFSAINKINKKHAKKIRGINAYSIWHLDHRPECEPEGMVFIPKLKIWVDIYLLSTEYKSNGFQDGRVIASGDKYEGREVIDNKEEFKYSDFKKIADSLQKRMIKEEEFIVAMNGVKENTSAQELDNGTIKHIADFTSKYGIEQATGVQWVWGESITKDDTEYAVALGGSRTDGVDAGSRCSAWSNYVWLSYWDIGCRFASDHLKLPY